jgi:hypothetical protein
MYWWLVNTISRMLESDEREVVLGDIAESKEPCSQALCDVLGLVVRRQATLSAGWRPWLTLASLILPLGMLLSVASRTASDRSAVYIWLYANNWDWALLSNPGFWRLLAETIVLLFIWYLTLACWAWTAGFVLGSVSRGMIQINGVLLCLMLLFGELVGAPRYFAYCEDHLHRTFGVPAMPDYNAAVFDVTFYRAMFPLIVQTVLVALPALWGMRQGAGVVRLGLRFRVALWTAAFATLAAMVMQERGLWLFLSRHIANAHLHLGPGTDWAMRLLQFEVFWPVMYLVANTIGRRRTGKIVPV